MEESIEGHIYNKNKSRKIYVYHVYGDMYEAYFKNASEDQPVITIHGSSATWFFNTKNPKLANPRIEFSGISITDIGIKKSN